MDTDPGAAEDRALNEPAPKPPRARRAKTAAPPPAPSWESEPSGAETRAAFDQLQARADAARAGEEAAAPARGTAPTTLSESPTTDAESSARAATVAGLTARDDRGRLRANLSKVSTESLVDELIHLTTAQNADPSLGVRVVPDENFHTNDKGVHTGGFRDSNRPVQRQKAIDRLFAELGSRGLEPDHVHELWMERDAIENETKRLHADATDFDPANFRFSIGGATPGLARRARTVLRAAFVSPFDEVRQLHPTVAETGERAMAAPAYAQHLATEQAHWALADESPDALRLAMQQKTLDQLRAVRDGRRGVTNAEQAELGIAGAPRPQAAEQLRLGTDDRQSLDQKIAAYEAAIPEGYAESADFQRVNAKLQPLIEQLETAGRKAGVTEKTARVADHGYMRLALPADNESGSPTPGLGRGTGTRQAAAARRATGLGAYTDDPFQMLAVDAADKIPKAARNDFYREVLKTGQPVRLSAKVPEGRTAVFVSDDGHVVGSAREAKYKILTTTDVAAAVDHVERIYNERPDNSEYGRLSRAVGGAASSAQLIANPKALATHANYLANVAGTGPVGRPLEYLANALPGGSSAVGGAKIWHLDRTAPETQATERELMRAGGMRPPDRQPGDPLSGAITSIRRALGPAAKLIDAHNVVFGPDGIDARTRIVLANDYRAAFRQRTGEDPSWSETARYVNMHAGSYVRGNAGALVDWLQSNRLAQFARMSTARVGTSARALTGNTGLPGTGAERMADALRNVGRKVALPFAGLQALNYLLSGHSTLSNAPGHAFDLQTGPDEKNGKPNSYVLSRAANPILGTVGSMGGEGVVRGDAGAAVEQAGNTALGIATSHPLFRLGFGLATGAAPYVEREGGLRTFPTTHTDAAGHLADRLRNAAGGLTNLGGQFLDSPTARPYGDSPLGRVADFALPAAVGQGTVAHGVSRGLRSDSQAALEGFRTKLRAHVGDPAAQEQVIKDAEADASANGLEPRIRRAALRSYMHELNAGRQTGALRFERQNHLAVAADENDRVQVATRQIMAHLGDTLRQAKIIDQAVADAPNELAAGRRRAALMQVMQQANRGGPDYRGDARVRALQATSGIR